MGSFVFKAGNSSSEQGATWKEGGREDDENYWVLVSMINQDFFIIIIHAPPCLANADSQRCFAVPMAVEELLLHKKRTASSTFEASKSNEVGPYLRSPLTRNARL